MSAVPPFPAPAPLPPFRAASARRRFSRRWAAALAAAVLLALLAVPALPVEAAAPSVPQNVSVTAGNRSLTVTWEAPTSANATSYAVQYKLSTATEWTTVSRSDFAALTETISIANSEFKSYNVRVLATNNDGDSTYVEAGPATPNRDIDTDSWVLGIWSQDGVMWAVAFGAIGTNVFAYDLETATVDASRNFTGPSSARGLCSDGTTWWILDRNDDDLKAYRFSDRSGDSDKDIDLPLGDSGVWCNDSLLLVGSDDSDAVLAYDLPSRSRNPGRDVSGLSAYGNSDLKGVWSDGDTVWVSDDDDDKIYAYGLDNSRRPGLDLDGLIARDNRVPFGIWSDGSVMWVAESNAPGNIYSYPLPKAADGGPEAWSASVSDDGTTVAITFDEPLDTAVTPTPSRFSVTIGSAAAAPPMAASHTSGDNRSITLTLTSPAAQLATVSIAYTDPAGDDTSGVVQDVDGNDLPSFTALAATPRPNLESLPLIGNFDQRSVAITLTGLSDLYPRIAQAFGTGSRAGGYVVKRVAIQLQQITTGDSASVSIWTQNSSGNPDELVQTLTAPTRLRNGENVFTDSAGPVLQGGATYMVVVERVSGSFSLHYVDAAGETDSPAAVGWSIVDGHRSYHSLSASWSESGGQFRVRLEGTGSDGPIKPGLPTDVMLTTPRDRVLAASWTAPTDGATATGYDLRHKPSSGGNSEWDETSAYVSTTSLETPDLRLVGSYDLQVRSVGAEYPGDWTATVQGTPTGSVNITAELTSLTLSGVTIADTFAGGTHSYTGSAGYATAVTTITPGLQDFQAVEYLDSSNRVLTDADDMTEGFQAALAVNENTIKVRVTAEDRVTRVTYTIVVTRAKPTVGVSAFSTADTEGASIEFLFERSVAAADALVIRFVVRESVAVLQAGSPTSVTIPADESQVTLELQTVDDQSYESNAIVAVTIESDSGYDIITGRDLASASVLDNDFPAATATLTVETPVDEGDAARVTVTITTNGDTIPHGPTGELRLTTATGTAGAEDFTDFTGGEVVTSVAGTAFLRTDINDDPDEEQWVYRYSNTWDIQTTDDDLREPNDETFNVVLAKVTSGDTPASPNIRLTSPSTRTITISPSDHASDANLSSLTLNPSAEISPELGAGGDYTASVPFNVTRITVRVTRADANGQTEWLDPADDSVLATSTSATSNRAYDLSYGENTIKIRVTAEDETTTRDYMLVITRELPVLRISTILQGTQLTESSFMIVGFAALPAAATETIRIRFRVSETTGDAIAQSVEDAPTTLSLNPPHRSVQAPFSLTNDDTWEEHATVVISVAESDHFTIGDTSGSIRSVLDDDFPEATATLSLSTTTANENDMDGPNAGDTVTATVTVTTARNEEPHENGGSIRLTLGTDADDATEDASSSDYRTIGSTTLSFPRSEFTHITAGNVYRLSKTVEIKIVNDSAKERDEVFTVTMNRVTSGSGQTDSAITFDSTATTHTVTIPQSDRSSDASLQSLSLSAGGPLSPGFSAGTTEYTAAVPFGDTQITINPQRNEPNSTLTYLDSADAALADASASAGFQVDLPLNTPLVVKLRVVAEDEITERTYTLTVTRQLPIVSIALPARSDLEEGDTVVATVTRNGTTDERTDFSLTIVDEFNTMTDAADVGTKSYTIAADTDSIEISVPTIDDDDWDEHSRLSMELETGSGYSVSDSESSVSRRLIDDDFPEAIATLELRNASDTAPLTGLVPEVENSIVGVRVTIETRRNEMPHEDAGSIWLITQEGPDPDGEGRNTAATGGVDYEEFRGDTGRLFFSRSSFSEEDGVYKSTTYEEISIVDDSDDEYEERFTVRIRTRPLSLYTTDPNITIADETLEELPNRRAAYVDIDRSDLADDPALGAIAFMSGSQNVGSLGEEFHPDTISYSSATVPFSFPQITLVPNTRSDAATIQYLDADDMTLDDANIGAGFQVDLPENEGKVVKIKVTAQDEMATRTYTVTILRRRPVASISVSGTEEPEGDEITYTVSLDGPVEVAAGVDVLVDVDGANVVESAGQKTVTVAMGNDSATLIVPTVDDDLWEEHTPVTATIVPGTNYRPSEVEAEVAATLTVQDDDFPDAVAVLTVNPNPVDEPPATPDGRRTGTSQISVQVTITTDRDEAPREGAGGIQLSTSDGTAVAGSDYSALTASQGLLRFNLGDFAPVDAGGSQRYQATQTVTIPITHDNEEEDAEDFTVAMALIPDGEPQESDSRLSLGSGESTPVTIAANDAHRVVDVVAQPTSGGANITVRLSNPTQRLITLYLDLTRYYFDGTQPQDIPLGAFGQRETTGIVDQFSLSDLGVELYDATLFVAAAHGPSELGAGDTFTTLGAGPAVSQVGSANVSQTGAQAEVLLINLETGVDYVVSVRFREVGTVSWTLPDPPTQTTQAPRVVFDLPGLRSGTDYEVEATIEADFDSGAVQSATFTTLPPGVNSVEADDASITENEAQVTVSVTAPNGTEVFLRYRTGGEDWTPLPEGIVVAEGDSGATFELSALIAGTRYQVEASYDSAFPAAQTASGSFMTAGSPPSNNRGIGSPIGGGGGGGGGPSGPSPSTVDFEWTVKHDIETLDSGHDEPTGSSSDGVTFWIVDNGSGADDEVYAYSLITGERVPEREFALDESNRAPRGIWSDGETVWVSDSGRDRVFVYDLTSGERLEGREIELDEANRDARGIWSDGVVLWVLDDRANALFAYDLASGRLLAHYSLHSANTDPRDVSSDGVTIWVSDDRAKRLFAYRLPSPSLAQAGTVTAAQAGDESPQPLERVNEEEFSKLSRASNNSPRGIWSDGDFMYVVDASDGRVYSYNMPDAIDARLATLSLSGVEIGEFDPKRTDYEGLIAEGVSESVVTAEAMQRRTDVVIDPPDADGNDANGHQVALQDISEVTVTVTSADGSRKETYRVHLDDPAPEPWPHCLLGDVATGFSLVVYEGGSVEELVACAQSRSLVALYALHDGAYVSYIVEAPAFVNRSFVELYGDGLPAFTPLVAGSGGPPSADPASGGGVAQSWPECLHGEVVEGFSLVLYEGGSVEDLEACARAMGVTALYALHDGAYVSYIFGAPAFVNQSFSELYAEGVPAVTPLVARSDDPSAVTSAASR